MANVPQYPEKTLEQQLEHSKGDFNALFTCFGEATDEIKLLRRRIRQLEQHITKLSLQLHQ